MLSVNDKIGEYVLVEFLATGGFGEVWKAVKQTRTGTFTFALKFFRPRSEDGVNFDKIKGEVATSQRLSGYPHIVSVIEADIFKNYIYIVSEFAGGGSLGSLLKASGGKAESFEQALNITLEILKGLEYIHREGIVHRDLKPENILIKKGIHCLCDFGISFEVKSHSRAENNAGTYEYMPPEAFEKKPHVSPHTDTWAVGVILQQLLTGSLPFPQKEIPSLIYAIMHDEPQEMPDDIPPNLRGIVRKALQKNRHERFQSAQEMRQALKDFQRLMVSNKEFEKIRRKEEELETKYKTELERQQKAAEAKLAEMVRELQEIKRKADLEKIQQKQNEIRKKLIEKERIDLDRQIAWYRDVMLEKTEYLPSAVERLKLTLGATKFEEVTRQFQRERLIELELIDERNNSGSLRNPPEPPKEEIKEEEIDDTHPEAAKKYFDRGFDCARDDFDGKIANYTKAIELKPDYADAYNNRGLAFYRKKDLDKAIADYSKAIELKPKFIHAYYHRGVAYHDQKLYDLAIEDFDKALELHPKFAAVYLSRGNSYFAKGDFDLAIKHFDRTIELQPKNFEAFNARGLAYAARKEFENALKDFDKAIEIRPEFLDAVRNKRDAHRALAEKNT
jgi:serine/threonine protein kinase